MGNVKQGLGPHNRRDFLRNAAVLGGGLAAKALCTSCACERAPAKMRCTGYRNGKLRVHLSGENGGDEVSISLNKLGIPEKDSEPLDYFCTYKGDLFWVTEENVYIRKMEVVFGGSLEATEVADVRHTRPDEYEVEGVRAVDASIWKNPDANWEEITVGTLTNNGLLQARRFSLRDIARNTPDRMIYNLKSERLGEYKWPEGGVAGGKLKALGHNRFAAVPIGEKGVGKVRDFYIVVFSENREGRFISIDTDVTIKQPWRKYPQLTNIIEVPRPVRYDRGLGGWVVNLVGERNDGVEKDLHIFAALYKDGDKDNE